MLHEYSSSETQITLITYQLFETTSSEFQYIPIYFVIVWKLRWIA